MSEKNKKIMSNNNPIKFLLYTSPQGDIKIEVFFKDETVWLTINKIAELFNTTKQNISYHLKNIYDSGELA